MAYIIDGNNVMGQTPGWHRDKSKARRRLLDQLAAFGRIKKARFTIVFDGEPDPWIPEGSAYRGVKVLYSVKGSDADTRIERLIESCPDRRGLTVVTSDRRLGLAVRSQGATVIRSGEFRRQIEEALEQRSIAEDEEQLEVEDINAWLKYFGALPTDDEMSDK